MTKSKKGIWVFIAVLLIGLLIAGLFWYKNYSEQQRILEEQRIAEEQAAQQAAQAAEEARRAEEERLNQIKARLAAGDTEQGDLKIAFLTFDDGPNESSNEVLDILARNDVKATFFTNGRPEYEDIYKRYINEGHVLGNHTWSHNYSYYNDTNTFLSDVTRLEDYLRTTTGVEPVRVFRFPGGSNITNMTNVNALLGLGYNFFDWTASAGDGSNIPLTPQETLSKILTEVYEDPVAVILCHAENPEKTSTRAALEPLIQQLKSEGYTFMTLDPSYNLAKFMEPTT